MAQPFACLCGTPSCRGTIAGARDMPASQLEGLWINAHIRELIERRDNPAPANGVSNGVNGANGVHENGTNGKVDETAEALERAVQHADEAAASARAALRSYLGTTPANGVSTNGDVKAGVKRRGVTSRELSGEMGGDTN